MTPENFQPPKDMTEETQLPQTEKLPPVDAAASGSDGDGRPKFELHRYAPRRAARGAEAAEVKVTWPEGDVEYLWMSRKDIRKNMKEWGACDGLLDALNAYRQNANLEKLP